ncbi:cytochrome c oxidase assembly protein COX18, mitochondrial isoform X2 [Cinclus cinclus]|uniref:cytochrome c oxidase assembly protein COX18, mitochondrial isoform X2 n=1 Tax=Cinclus cinclus TaxID=127875 RepID=UPI002E13477D
MWRLARAGARAPPALAAAGAGAGPGPGGLEGWYGWAAGSAPVHWAEGGLAALQEATGLPCWAAIAGGAAVLRTAVTLPLAAHQGRLLAKVENLQPEIKELAKRLRYEVSVRGKQLGWSDKVARFHFAKNMRRIVTELYIRDNCHPFKATVLLWVQIPMWVCVSLALRNCSVGALGSAGAASSPPVTCSSSLAAVTDIKQRRVPSLACKPATRAVFLRRSAVVYRPDGARFHVDFTSFPGAGEFAGGGDLCFPKENARFPVPEACYELLPRGVCGDDPYCCHSALLHGAVLAVLQPGGTVPQPPAALSRLPPALPHPEDQIRLRYSLQGHHGCLGHQIQL